jgi:hypothetical protein
MAPANADIPFAGAAGFWGPGEKLLLRETNLTAGAPASDTGACEASPLRWLK